MDEAKKNYQIWRIIGRLEVEVIHAKPIFGNIEFLSVWPIVNISRDLVISGVCKDLW